MNTAMVCPLYGTFSQALAIRQEVLPPRLAAVSSRLSGLATAARASAQLGLAIGVAVTAGLSVKAGYMAAMLPLSRATNGVVSTGIVLGSTVAVRAGVGVLVEGARGLVRAPTVLSPAFMKSIQALGVAAYLCAMLGSAYRALCEGEESAPLGSYMLANAAGQVLAGVVAEMVANQIVPHAIVPTELVGGDGLVITSGSPQALAMRPLAEVALAVGQVMAHVALMWTVLDKIPAVQLALGAPEHFRPGQESARDQALAGLGVALLVGASEVGRVAMGEMSMALAQTAQGATIRAQQLQQLQPVQALQGDENIQAEANIQAEVAVGPVIAPESLSRWQHCCRSLDRVAERIGLNGDGRGRMASYVPILNLYVDTLTTGPGSTLVGALAGALKKPLFGVAIGIANFTLSLQNVVDVVLRHRPVSAPPVVPVGGVVEGVEEVQVAGPEIEIQDLHSIKEADFLTPGQPPSPGRVEHQALYPALRQVLSPT